MKFNQETLFKKYTNTSTEIKEKAKNDLEKGFQANE